MKAPYALRAFCDADSPHKRPVMRIFNVFVIVSLQHISNKPSDRSDVNETINFAFDQLLLWMQ